MYGERDASVAKHEHEEGQQELNHDRRKPVRLQNSDVNRLCKLFRGLLPAMKWSDTANQETSVDLFS